MGPRPRRPGLTPRPRRAAAVALALALATTGEGALAAGQARPPPAAGADSADREAARTLAQLGFERLERGDHAGAAELFRKAEERFHAPTHWLYIARAEATLGRLFEAERAYERVLADELPESAPRPFLEAQASARAELGPLRARVPQIRVRVTGVPPGPEPAITVDGAPIGAGEGGAPARAPGSLGARGGSARVAPGKHVVRVVVPGAAPIERAVVVAEGETKEVAIAIEPPARSGSVVPGAVALGLGAAGLTVGAVTGALSLGKVSDLEAICPDRRCSENEQALGDEAGALGTASTIGFIAGGVLVATGVVLLVVRPSGGPPGGAAAGLHLEAAVAPGALLLRGAF